MQSRLTTRLALATVGVSLIVAGAVLLTRAIWIALAVALGPVWAFAIVGAGLALLGVTGLALASRSRRRAPPTRPALSEAFFQGLRAGQATAARRR